MRFLRKNPDRQGPVRHGLLGRLGKALRKTRSVIADGIAEIVGSRTSIDDALLEDIETILLTADVGVEATQRIVGSLEARVSRREMADGTALLASLESDMLEILEPVEAPLSVPDSTGPYVILVIGINGAGKTTTIGKLAARLRSDGRSVMIAAGDTFRAAAIEQVAGVGCASGRAGPRPAAGSRFRIGDLRRIRGGPRPRHPCPHRRHRGKAAHLEWA